MNGGKRDPKLVARNFISKVEREVCPKAYRRMARGYPPPNQKKKKRRGNYERVLSRCGPIDPNYLKQYLDFLSLLGPATLEDAFFPLPPGITLRSGKINGARELTCIRFPVIIAISNTKKNFF